MAYTDTGGLLSYFAPNIPLATSDVGVLHTIDIGASSADHGEYVCFKPCVIKRTVFVLTGEAASGTSVAPTVIFKKRPTPLSATGETLISTLTVPTGLAVGKGVFEEIDVRFGVGDSLEISHTVGTGTPTGQGVASAECMDCSESMLNTSDLTATT